METITRNYICSREIYLQAKEYQKKLAEWGKHYDVYCRQKAAAQAEYKIKNPEPRRFSVEHGVWLQNYPHTFARGAIALEARHHNIVYAVIKGKVYSQVEVKVRKDNEPDLGLLEGLVTKYNINFDTFLEAAKYERNA